VETVSTVKDKFNATLSILPPEGVEELGRLLDGLADKYQSGESANIVALGGLWETTPLDIEEEDVRALRQHISDDLVNNIS
jgi:hypothetical protein